jgi:hypothetical protein
MRIVILLLITLTLSTTETTVPVWVLGGIMAQETRSYYTNKYNTIVYIDQRTGAAGELSAFQITYGAWKQVKIRGERFQDLAIDQDYAEQVAIRYLLWLYNGTGKRSWVATIQQYNAGPGGHSRAYYNGVRRKARKAGLL